MKFLSGIEKYYWKKNNLNTVGKNNKNNRDRWLKEKLKNIPDGSRVLDAGAGELQYKKFCSHLKYVSQDFGKYDGVGDQVGLQTKTWDQSKLDIVCDIINIPEPDESFNAVMCIEVLEHLPDPISALKELARLLKPNGSLIITAPFCSLTHFSPYFYQTGFSEEFYKYWYKKFNLEIVEVQRNGNYFEYLAQETRRISYMGEKYAMHKLNSFEKFIIKNMLEILNNLSGNDTNSNEMLCFGLNVLAQKKAS